MAEQIESINVDVGIGAIGTNNGTINIGINEKFIPTFEWAKEKVKIALNGIGNRYITYNNLEYQDLNIELPLQELLNQVTDIEDFNYFDFYSNLNNDDYQLARNYAFSAGVKHTFERYKKFEQYKVEDKCSIFNVNKKDENEYIICVFYNFSEEIEILLNFYTYYAELLKIFSNKKSLKKVFFDKYTADLINHIDHLYSQIKTKPSMKLIDEHMGPGNGSYTVEKIYNLKEEHNGFMIKICIV